jgi:aspartyl-tRNA(Asn)/glutamyl-tRNA(Gln) amidotransferase subunit C
MLDKKTIKTLVTLSRIDCTEAEQDDLLDNLQKILSYIDLLDEIDTTDVAPCNQVIAGTCNVMREDVVGETLPRDVFLENAPSQIGGMIRVPPVMKATS